MAESHDERCWDAPDSQSAAALRPGLPAAWRQLAREIAVARAGAPADLWGENYWAQKGDAKLTVYRKFPALKPRSGERKVRARLVPGAWIVAVLSLSSYDLDVPPPAANTR